MRLSVACNFDDALIDGLDGYPVYEVYGKVTADYAGGGRPSFYLPTANRQTVERTVKKVHDKGIRFNYLLNASCMGNAEYTREGQRHLRETLDWVSDIGVDSVTVGSHILLKMVKRNYPSLSVRISAHRFTDTPRKARFWEDMGADTIVLNETAFAREFSLLRAIRESVSCDLSLIVNNSCRQDCAIAGSHASSLNHASQKRRGAGGGFPLDYHMLFCLQYRLAEPVNYVRANWIRPEDLHYYEEIGIDNFKIVERNTPTPDLLRRVKAYSERRYDGNLLDLVLPFSYPERSYTTKAAREAYSTKRAVKHFFKPSKFNVTKLTDIVALGKQVGLLYPRQGDSPVVLDNRKLDGFIEPFLTRSCIDRDCETCRYCHDVAERTLEIDEGFRSEALGRFNKILDEMYDGSFWDYKPADLLTAARDVTHAARRTVGRVLPALAPPPEAPVPTCPAMDDAR